MHWADIYGLSAGRWAANICPVHPEGKIVRPISLLQITVELLSKMKYHVFLETLYNDGALKNKMLAKTCWCQEQGKVNVITSIPSS